jgi:hypothetical protein
LTFHLKYGIIIRTYNKIYKPSGKVQGAGLRFNAWQAVLRFFINFRYLKIKAKQFANL